MDPDPDRSHRSPGDVRPARRGAGGPDPMSARAPNRPSDPSRTAVFTGTFDPMTLGHLDVIRRGRLLFEHLIVGIGVNPNKASLFSIEERVELARRVVAPYPDVSVESLDRKSTRLNSSHSQISYAVFCLKK